ncbi:MAG: AAA family ATPase [Clostridia bacterium]|nr:AAA family ATPase [Clostridia bacterium]MBQ3221957.1 AAA family ATPase [Clostridia bacterium]
MNKLFIELDARWVLQHRTDDILPVPNLKRTLLNEAAYSIMVEYESYNALTLVTEADASAVANWVVSTFSRLYSPEEASQYLRCRAETTATPVQTPVETPVEKSGSATESSPIDELLGVFQGGEKTAPRTSVTAGGDVLAKVDELVGSEEFKALAKEIVEIAPQLTKGKMTDIFTAQSYLFAINDGYGLTTVLDLFAAVVGQSGLRSLSSSCVLERRLYPPKGETLEPFEEVFNELKRGNSDYARILSIDISEWMDKTNSRPFRQFLSILQSRQDEFIFVFRVPFVEKEVLEALRYSLNDLMFVRVVSFPPFSEDEIRSWAEKKLKNAYGFTVAEDAWKFFFRRIAEEKGDGKFYGLNTVKKVIRELLYKKQLRNARENTNDTVISQTDTEAICGAWGDNLLGEEQLEKLVGGAKMKERLLEIISQIELARAEQGVKTPCVHMRFVGNPGTGKTTVARILGKMLKERGLLRVGNFYEYSGRDFCGRYIGETAPKTASMCRDAYGSVLFIDEAYTLFRGAGDDKDYGREALDTLIAEMENHRSDLVVIMAGYTDEMETLMHGNAGLASRMPYMIEFPNFTREELFGIFQSMAQGKFECQEGFLEAAKAYFDAIPDSVISSKEFSNARFARNLYERTWAKAAMRCQLEKAEKISLTKDDFDRAVADKEFKFNEKKKSRLGFYED